MEDLILHITRTGDVVGGKYHHLQYSSSQNTYKTDIISQKQNGKNWKSYEVKNSLVCQTK